jgi:hypothetical protein
MILNSSTIFYEIFMKIRKVNALEIVVFNFSNIFFLNGILIECLGRLIRKSYIIKLILTFFLIK